MKYYFIINPNSGKIDTNQFEQRILKECSKEKIKYKIFYTHNAGDAKKFAKKIPDEECVVFSVGGDGNLNAVLNGLAGSKNKILGNIPTGSGNDFERTLNQYDDGIHDFDFGIINGRHFINVACVGLDADVANNISWIRKKKWIPVSQRYNASILYTFIKYEFKKVKVQIDDNQSFENQCTILAICNGQYYGGGFRMAPHATLDDGLFDVYFVEKMPKVKVLPLFVKLLSAKHEKSPKIKKYQGKKVVIDSDKRYTFNVDGEIVTDNHFEIEMRKNRGTAYGVIGLGRFGTALAIALAQAGKEVIAIDRSEEKIKNIRRYTDYAFVAENLSMETLKEIGIQNCDVAIICIGEKVDVSILTTMSAIELGVPHVIAKATSEEQGAVLKKIGAEVVYPERDMALRLGKKLVSDNFLDFVSLSNSVEIRQIPVGKMLIGKSVQESDIRRKYKLNIIAIENENQTNIEILPDYHFQTGDIIVVIGKTENMDKFETED